MSRKQVRSFKGVRMHVQDRQDKGNRAVITLRRERGGCSTRRALLCGQPWGPAQQVQLMAEHWSPSGESDREANGSKPIWTILARQSRQNAEGRSSGFPTWLSSHSGVFPPTSPRGQEEAECSIIFPLQMPLKPSGWLPRSKTDDLQVDLSDRIFWFSHGYLESSCLSCEILLGLK